METAQKQISAVVSKETVDLLDRYVRARGVKKGFLIETALLHYLRAIEEIPEAIIIPSRIVVSRESGAVLLDRIEDPPEPTPAMKELFADGSGESIRGR